MISHGARSTACAPFSAHYRQPSDGHDADAAVPGRRLGVEHLRVQRLLARVDEVLRRAEGRSGHIFNLGHGILPGTPVEAVKAVVEHVHGAGTHTS